MPCRDWIIILRPWHLARQFLKGLPLRLRYQKRREDPAEHEQREDLHDVIEPGGGGGGFGGVGTRARAQGAENRLGNYGADFAGGRGDAV